jgi:hypothetical protein
MSDSYASTEVENLFSEWWCDDSRSFTLVQCVEIARRTMDRCRIPVSKYRLYAPYLVHLLRSNMAEPKCVGYFGEARLDKRICEILKEDLRISQHFPTQAGLFKQRELKKAFSNIKRSKKGLNGEFTDLVDTTIQRIDQELGVLKLWMERTILGTFIRENRRQNYNYYETEYNNDKLLNLFLSIKTVDDAYPGRQIRTRTLILFTHEKIYLVVRKDILSLVHMYWFHLCKVPCRRWPVVIHNYFTSVGEDQKIRRCIDHCILNYILHMTGVNKSGVRMKLAAPESLDFKLYSLLPIILSSYESKEAMNKDFPEGGEVFKRQTLANAVVSFLCIKDQHFIAPSDAFHVLCRISDFYSEKKQMDIQQMKRDHFLELMRIASLSDPDSPRVCNTPVKVDHRLIYELCASGLLKQEDVRQLFLAVQVFLEDKDIGFSYFSKEKRRSTLRKSSKELGNRIYTSEINKEQQFSTTRSVRTDIITIERLYLSKGRILVPWEGMKEKDAVAIVRSRPVCWFMNYIENSFLGYRGIDCMFRWPKYVDLDTLVDGTNLRFMSSKTKIARPSYFDVMVPIPKITRALESSDLDTYGFAYSYLFLYPNLLKHVFYRKDYAKEDPLSDSCGSNDPGRGTKLSIAKENKVSLSRRNVRPILLLGASNVFDIAMGNTYFQQSGILTSAVLGTKRRRGMKISTSQEQKKVKSFR